METDIRPKDVVKYDLYKNDFPKEMNPLLLDHFFMMFSDLRYKHIRTINSLITLSPNPWYKRTNHIYVYAFGTFRQHYRAIEKAAHVLSDFYILTDIFPIVFPVTNKEWNSEVEHKGSILRRIQRKGIMVYKHD